MKSNSSPFPTQSLQDSFNHHHQSSPNREPFYLSLKVQNLVFTQGSVLKSLVERWNQQRKAGFPKKHMSQSSEFESMFRNDQNKAVFFLQLHLINENQQQQKLCSSIAVGQVNEVSATTKLYNYPIDLTEMTVKAKQQMNSFVYNYSPQQFAELNLILYMQLAESPEQKTLVGQCRLDPNLFIEMYLDEGISCIKDCKKMSKRVQGDKEMDQQVEILIEMAVARERMQLEMARKQAKRGINVMDFKEHIRQILKEKQQLEIEEEEFEEDVSVEQPQSQQQLQINSQKPRKSTLRKYMSYLNRNVESQLQFFNPQKERIEKEVKKLFTERTAGLQKMKVQAEKVKKSRKQAKQTPQKHDKLTPVPNATPLIGNDKQGRIKEIIKIVIFVVVSAILLYMSMTPSRKVPLPTSQHQNEI